MNMLTEFYLELLHESLTSELIFINQTWVKDILLHMFNSLDLVCPVAVLHQMWKYTQVQFRFCSLAHLMFGNHGETSISDSEQWIMVTLVTGKDLCHSFSDMFYSGLTECNIFELWYKAIVNSNISYNQMHTGKYAEKTHVFYSFKK